MVKRKQRSGSVATASANGLGTSAAPSNTTTTNAKKAKQQQGAQAMSLLRLRALEHGVEENDLASVNGLGEVLPLLARLKEGRQVRCDGGAVRSI